MRVPYRSASHLQRRAAITHTEPVPSAPVVVVGAGPVGLTAALFLATSPILLFQIVQPMSDVAVTAWWAVALVFALSALPNGALAAGAASGLAVLTRHHMAPVFIPLTR